jgi:hypothetical protein
LRLSVLFYEIHPLVRHQFFARFEPELREAFPELPQLPDPPSSTDDFDDAVYQLLDDPAFLPEPMRDALIAIQELAAPPNRHLLRGLILQSNLDREPADTPDQLALRFWLRHPFTPGGLEPLRAQLPSHLRAPVPRKDNGHNGETQTAELDLDLPAPPPAPQPPALRPGDLAAIARFPRNKISKLPPDVREEINQLIRRRVAYKDIVARVGPRAPGLNASNLSRWKKTGYLLWLADQQRREDAEAQIQLLFDLVRENDNGKLHEATQQIAALRISQVLAAFDTASLTQSLQQHPQAFVRLVQTLPGLSRGGMDCERLLVELAERKAALQPNNERKRGISQPTLQYMQEKLNLM